MKYCFNILFVLFFLSRISFAQSNFDCATSTITACNGNPTFPFTTNTSGNTWGNVQDLPGNSTSSISNPATNPSSGNDGCLLSGELNATWVQINITSPGTLEFNISQSGYTDWAMWPYNATACNDIQNNTLAPIRCNWNASSTGGTGIGPVPAGADPGNFEPTLNVNAGESFIVCISNYSNVNGTVSMNFTGTTGTSCVPYSSSTSQSICPAQTATLTAATTLGGPTFVWIPGSLSTASIAVSPSVTTVYTVTIVGTNTVTGAVTTQTNTSKVTVYAVPAINLTGSSIVCQGNTISLNTSVGLTSYTWTGPAAFTQTTSVGSLSIPNANIAMIGPYVVLAKTAQGCTTTATASVDVIPTSSITVTPTIGVCEGTTVSLTANTAAPSANSYSWAGPATYTSLIQNPTLSNVIPSQSGIYTVTANFTSGTTTCSRVNTTSVTVYALPTLTFTSNSMVCQGSSISLNATSGINSYTWTGPPALNQITTTNSLSIPNANTNMSGTYTLVAQTAQSCSATATTSVGIIGTSSVAVTPTISVCQGSSVFLTSNTAVPSANAYSWTGPSGYTSSVQNPTIINAIPNQSGIYTVTAIFTSGSSSCTTLNTTSVTVIGSAPIPLTTIPTVCNNGTINLVAPNGWSTYSWIGPNGFSSTSQNPSINNANLNDVGTYSLTTTISGCASQGTVAINVFAPLNFLSTPVNTVICFGKTGVLSTLGGTGGSGNYSYVWNPATNLSSPTTATTIVTGSTTTIYTLTLADAICPVTLQQIATTTVNVNPKPVITFSTSNSRGCEPFCTDLVSNSIPASVNCVWKFSNNVSGIGCSSPNFCFDDPAAYNATLTVTDVNGCVDSLSQTAFIIVDPKPTPSFNIEPINPTILINEVGFFDYSYIGAPMQSWHWDFGDIYVSEENDTSSLQNSSHIYESVGIYTVSLAVTNKFGCKDTVSRLVNIEDEFALFIPNAFTPSKSEGKNDTFYVQGRGFLVDTFEMTIFDRWGNVLYSTTDISKGWDGTGKSGARVESGVYVYKISVKDYKSRLREFFGHITLL